MGVSKTTPKPTKKRPNIRENPNEDQFSPLSHQIRGRGARQVVVTAFLRRRSEEC